MNRISTVCRTLATTGLVAAALTLGSMPAHAAGAVSEQDRTFLAAAHQSNLAEIAAGQAALKQATTAMVKEHGQVFITDHTKQDGDLTKVAATLGVTLPSAPSADQQAQLAQVSAQAGAAFDKAWTAQQITGHQQALALGTTELASGSNTDVKALATAAAPVVKKHLAMLQGMPTSVGAGTGGQAAQHDNGVSTPLIAGGALLVAGGGLALSRRRRAVRA